MKKVMFIAMAAAMLMAVGCKNGNKNAQAVEGALNDAAEAVEGVVSEAAEAATEAGEAVRDLALDDVDQLTAEAEANAEETLIKTLGVADAVPFVSVEEKPTFEGGDANTFNKWINTNVVYPQAAIDGEIQGKVLVGFVIDEEGNVSNVKVIKGVNELLDKAAAEAISKSPKWEPGKQNGSKVKVAYTMPVIFKLQ
ncbi:MAG: energy transducer TonB [Bacteroidales bacterium]|nr:energy transducer TonB [Bacteroidales bacterium]